MAEADLAIPEFTSRSESFIVRPRQVPSAFSTALSSVELRVLTEEEFVRATSVTRPKPVQVDVEKRGSLDPELRLGLNLDAAKIGAEELGCSFADISLVVIIRCHRMMLSQVVFSRTLEELSSDSIRLSIDSTWPWFVEVIGRAPTYIEVYLLLNKELPLADGNRWELGYWLTGEAFVLNSERDAWNFDPTPLLPEVADREGVPRSSLVYVTYQEAYKDAETPLHLEKDAKEVLIIYVNASVLDQMAATTSEELRSMLALLLQQEALQQLVSLLHQESKESDAPAFEVLKATESLAYMIVSTLCSPSEVKLTGEQMYRLVCSEPNRAAAFCYAASQSTEQIKNLLQGE